MRSGSWLFLGEGPFAFTAALLRMGALDAVNRVLCTCRETEALARQLYGDDSVAANVSALRAAPNVEVRFDVDATTLRLGERFTTVCFMFPALGRKGRIDLSRQLLRDTAVAVAPHLDVDRGQLLVALAAGQGGTYAELREHRREAANTWMVRECMAAGGLFLSEAWQLDQTHPWGATGYQPTGRRGHASSFRSAGAVLHRFALRGGGVPMHPTAELIYEPRDVSIYPNGASEEALLAAVSSLEGVQRAHVLDRFVHNGRPSLTIRMTLQGLVSPAEANALQQRVGAELERQFGAHVR